MNMELVEQSIQYTFAGEKYNKGKKTRILQNVNTTAKPEDLVKVGKALSSLQKDKGLLSATLIQHSDIEIESLD